MAMKRVLAALLLVALGAVSSMRAQGLTMQMSNGWSFSFAGNINAFLVYEHVDSAGAVASPGAVVGNSEGAGFGQTATRIRTGLLPAFATFAATGKEGGLDLGVHFGFAPQIQCGPGANNDVGNLHDCFGAQIDMRQVFLTVGGSWGQLLAGKELGLFGRQNILNDQTLFGIGATGGQISGGTTLGRIGFGYDYPNFVTQMTYSSRSDRPTTFSIGIFDPAINGEYSEIKMPRVETEVVWSHKQHKFWVGGLFQNNKDLGTTNSATAYGVSGGVKLGFNQFAIVGSGFYGKGIGTTLLFINGTSGSGAGSDGLRTSYGYIGQFTFTPTGSKLTVAGSYGANTLKASTDEAGSFKTENGLISGGIYYQWTKSLKWVLEGDYDWSKQKVAPSPQKNSSFAGATGLMLFF
jgi:hypothetical protein